MMAVIVVIVVWAVVSQAAAWLVAGDDEQAVLEVWSAIFLLGPLLVMGTPIYLLARAAAFFEGRDVSVDDVVL